MIFSVIDAYISYCFTHKRKTFPIFHAIDVFSLLFLCIYLALALSIPLMTNHRPAMLLTAISLHADLFYRIHQPIPHALVCYCLDSLPLPYFSKSYLHLASLNLTSTRHFNFILSLLLIFACDVELNPGPVSPPSNLSIYCLNIRSASTITDKIKKPELIQQIFLMSLSTSSL